MLNLPHVASRVFGTPLMIARAKLEVILGVLAPRLAGGAVEPIDAEADPAPATSITVERIAVVSVIGTLVSRSGYLAATSGLVSYADIGDAIAVAMDDPTVRGVILDVDSPGGEVGGLFDLVEQMRAIKTGNGKPLWAVPNASALSAAEDHGARLSGVVDMRRYVRSLWRSAWSARRRHCSAHSWNCCLVQESEVRLTGWGWLVNDLSKLL
jgi:hypothetical protein